MSINYDVILSPVITEKATRMTEANQVVFRVTLDATKPAIAKAVADLFKVKVKAVNTVIVKGKRKASRGKIYTRSRHQESDRDPGRGPPDRHHHGSLSHGSENTTNPRLPASASWCWWTVPACTRAVPSSR